MNLTLSRIATIDIYVAFFILLMFYTMYCFLKRWKKNRLMLEEGCSGQRRRRLLKKECRILLCCGISTGCAIATKWTGVYAAAGIAVIFFSNLIPVYWKKENRSRAAFHLKVLFGVCMVSFVAIPVVIYCLSYLPYLDVNHSKGLLQTVWDNGVFMLQYHKNTIFEHPYSSEWYEWIWMKMPLLDAYTSVSNGKLCVVATFVNPVICWGGVVALLHNIYLWRCKKDEVAAYLSLSYIAMLLPWLFIHRTVFIYQYFGCVILLVFLIGHSLEQIKKETEKDYMMFILIVSVCVFLLFYPIMTGFNIQISFIKQFLRWLPTWPFILSR